MGLVWEDLWLGDHAGGRRAEGEMRPVEPTPAPLIQAEEHGGEKRLVRARLHAMSDDASQPPLPPLGDHRPTRDDDAPAEDAREATALLLQPDRQPAQADHAPTESARAAVDPMLPPTDPDAAPAPRRHHFIGRTTSVLTACIAHVLVLLALISTPSTEFGDGGHTLDAISVSIIPASAIDARQPTADASASAAPAQIAPEPGADSTASEAKPEKIAAPPEPKTEPSAKEPDEIGDRLAAPAEPAPEAVPDEARAVTSAPPPLEETKVASVERPTTPAPPEKDIEDKPPEEMPAQSSPAASAGGATSHGTAADQLPRPAAAAASRGAVNAYGMAVQSALLAVDQREAKARASASRSKGTVVVRISLDEKGALINTEVVTSSGRPQLDAAALLLIRLATFPTPPPGLTAIERSYLAPIRFR